MLTRRKFWLPSFEVLFVKRQENNLRCREKISGDYQIIVGPATTVSQWKVTCSCFASARRTQTDLQKDVVSSRSRLNDDCEERRRYEEAIVDLGLLLISCLTTVYIAEDQLRCHPEETFAAGRRLTR
jgi:hypothetical protein